MQGKGPGVWGSETRPRAPRELAAQASPQARLPGPVGGGKGRWAAGGRPSETGGRDGGQGWGAGRGPRSPADSLRGPRAAWPPGGVPRADQELRNVIDKLAQFVARNGPEFEKMTMEKQKDNPKFSFLFGGEFYSYYRCKLALEQQQRKCPGPGAGGRR